MSDDYRYTYQKNKKYRCPNCDRKTFVRYLDHETNKLIPDDYGKCDRADKCNYHVNPYTDGYAKKIKEQERGLNTENWKSSKRYKPTPTEVRVNVPLPLDVLKRTLKVNQYQHNTFVNNLLHNAKYPFKLQDVNSVISQYYLGTISKGYRKGAITFPFIDKIGNVRAIQVKQFDKTNHTTSTDFIHSMIEAHYNRLRNEKPKWLTDYINNDSRVTCLFGAHLLKKYPYNPIALVEAPKTAIYGTLYFGPPETSTNFLWLAVYNLTSLTVNRCKALEGRNVILFPDLSETGNAFDLWSKKAKELNDKIDGATFKVSDLLESVATPTERTEGGDLADYLINIDWRQTRQQTTKEIQSVEANEVKILDQVQPLQNIDSVKSVKSDGFKTNLKNVIGHDGPIAFVNEDGMLFIKTPFANTFTVYNCIEDYNFRTKLPTHRHIIELDITECKPVFIDIKTLKVAYSTT